MKYVFHSQFKCMQLRVNVMKKRLMTTQAQTQQLVDDAQQAAVILRSDPGGVSIDGFLDNSPHFAAESVIGSDPMIVVGDEGSDLMTVP